MGNHFDECWKANWAALPVLSHTVSSALSRVKAISDSLEAFILEVKRTPGVYKGAISIENDSELQVLSRWSLLLIHRTEQMLKKRFDLTPGSLLWAASLFNRRTWPVDVKFPMEEVSAKLNALREVFPEASEMLLVAENFVTTAQAMMRDYQMKQSRCNSQGLQPTCFTENTNLSLRMYQKAR